MLGLANPQTKREQCWERWTKKAENGVGADKKRLLFLLRKVANSPKYEGNNHPFDHNYKEALKELKASSIYKGNGKIQRWLSNYWIPVHKRWVKAYMEDEYNISVNTNNGGESQNKLLKYSCLPRQEHLKKPFPALLHC